MERTGGNGRERGEGWEIREGEREGRKEGEGCRFSSKNS
jgi:hypothetical protein